MMKMAFFLFFMTPLVSNWWLMSMVFMLAVFFLFLYSPFTFTSYKVFFIGIDTLSWGLIVLTCWIVFLMFIASYKFYSLNINSLQLSLLTAVLLLTLVFFFSSTNLMLLYIFFEASLIPTLFLIFGWGNQPERLFAGYYLLFYTLFGSLPFLLMIFYVKGECGSLTYSLISLDCNLYMYMSFVLAFLFKMPLLFFHFWLPKAHVEAPISGSMILAGVLLKLGGYGLFRMFSFMNPASFYHNFIFLSIGVYSCVMVGLICLLQIDMKSMIAYSSISHMGLVISGIMSLNMYGVLGSYLLMIGHGLCSCSLFCLVNMSYERVHSRSLYVNKGLISVMPIFSLFMFLSSINNMSSPPSLNLLGEIFIIIGCMSWSLNTLFFMGVGSFLSCAYSIYLYSIICHGNLCRGVSIFSSLTYREMILLLMHLIPLNFMVLNLNMFIYLY
uniref:NADH dehydrogenase subunit 4 n=1 Tax=Urolabida histrionica TaxID=2880905 RepID=UPI001D1098CB|nr:NADH dehydrogenase subunit 4 [Urolabida histrionica]UCC46138.1 NADH dehydrogenase subunit 4 [Urolabida histrionica]